MFRNYKLMLIANKLQARSLQRAAFMILIFIMHIQNGHAQSSGKILTNGAQSSAKQSVEAESNSTNAQPRMAADDTVSGNPAFTNFDPGTGALGRLIQLPEDKGIRLGGVSLGDINKLFTGGNKPGAFSANQAFILGASVDTEKAIGWKGASFGVNFLQVNVQDTNGYAGSVPGYNSISGVPPFNRTELYEYWVTQELIEDVLKVRVGKVIPSVDFNNVTRVTRLKDNRQNVSSLSGLLYTSIFVNPTLLGVIGGYEDSVFGVTTSIAPTKNTWVTVGSYDGNKARGIPTGLHNPNLSSGYVFNIAEAGMSWLVGEQQHPGQFGIGAWYQTGKFDRPGLYGNLQTTGEAGLYLYGGQRIWAGDNIKLYQDDDASKNKDNAFESKKVSSISIFYQYGVNNSKTMAIRQFSGMGFTAFSMFAGRPDDSFGAGMGISFLNQNLFHRASELMFQTYYQAAVIPDAVYLQPTLSYIPTPGQNPKNTNYYLPPDATQYLSPALAGTLRLTAVF